MFARASSELVNCEKEFIIYSIRMSKRSGSNQDSTKAKRAKKGEPFIWGQPGLYTKFIQYCVDKFEKDHKNVFEDGVARDEVASAINTDWVGCTAEKIRSKIRQPGVMHDLAARNKDLIPTKGSLLHQM